MKHLPKALAFGFLSWLIPFLAAFVFFKDGQLVIDEMFFKSIMVVVSMLAGAILVLVYFKTIEKRLIISGLMLGIMWLFINLVLDILLVNRGFFEMTYIEYFQEIGLRYLSIPIFTTSVGWAIEQSKTTKKTDTKVSE